MRDSTWAGVLLGAGVVGPALAVAERIPVLAGGSRRDYVVCRAAQLPDHCTEAAIGLILLASVAALVAAILVWGRGKTAGLLGLVVVAGLLVAADGVDARGERIVAKAAAQPFDEDVCGYGGVSYTATPGWFFP
ncbi:hypothetical protein [Streptomyces sp. NBC_01262]|uniref:hypothetical protein n=1 Tax=Streptomyces sp. NBC_01262 TaxID=2903803 RepID=UPI002E2EFA8E|nr:hypothetical protein [Streptomyces sp. NBC_01262]